MKVTELNKTEFSKRIADLEESANEWKYLGTQPAIIDFYATWCGPCKALAPILDELAAEYDGKLSIYKIDVDKEKELAGAFGVRSIPTLLLIPVDGPPHIIQGALPKHELQKAIESVLLPK